MTDERPSAAPRAPDRVDRTTRRRVLAGLGAGAVAGLAGCGSVDGGPTYERGTVDAEGPGRNASEMSAAAAVADQDANTKLASMDSLVVRDHEFVLEDGFMGSTVQGTLENRSEDRLQTVEVRVRVLDDAGRYLGRYVASNGDLPGGAVWNFTVVLLTAPEKIDAYEVAAFGLSG